MECVSSRGQDPVEGERCEEKREKEADADGKLARPGARLARARDDLGEQEARHDESGECEDRAGQSAAHDAR